ncbi:hypothetical protein CROQUDRAFT_41362 [Cronartium quercuum f. sp. fusiforme G11]|uniref:Long-chain-alcohol oxidase n=1 Tax=Cronartium quercuum f. sp. fusiforme G11 TaxID=708437 RepID=A0A9P6TDK3_9BASI|nr:hypothetical protein CROQUDRAFT_41362 [Cronartium quercuum f. sp. fusiforme G11]
MDSSAHLGSNVQILISQFGFTQAHLQTLLVILNTVFQSEPSSDHATSTLNFSTLPDFTLDTLAFKLLSSLPANSIANLAKALGLLGNKYTAYLLTGHFASIDTLSINTRETILAGFSRSSLLVKRELFSALVTFPLSQIYGTSLTLGRAIGYPVDGDPRLITQPERRQSSFPFKFLQPSLAPEVIEVDILVIGSGAGGSVTASVLAKAGHKVLVIEKGPYLPTEKITGAPSQAGQMFEGDGMITTADSKLLILAASTFGGGTTINWSASLPTPYHVRRAWATQYGLPYFVTGDFAADLAAVVKRMGVSIDSIVHSRANQLFMKGCRLAGIHVDQIPQNTAGHRHDCGMCGSGCPFGEKQGATRTWLKDCAEAGGQFMADANVERVLFGQRPEELTHTTKYLKHSSRPSARRTRAVGALVRLKDHEEPVVVRARKAVVCSGGALQTPALLLRSGIDGGGTVGVGLHLHPVSFVTGWFDEEIRPWEGSIMTAISCEVENLKGDHFGAKIEVISSAPGLYAGIGARWYSSVSHREDMANYKNSFTLVIICRDRDGGRVRIDGAGRPVIEYVLSKRDQESLLAGVVKGCEIMKSAGAKKIGTAQYVVDCFEVNNETGDGFEEWIEKVQIAGIRPSWCSLGSAHQMGSCPMGSDQATSVVNSEGKVWGFDSLYIADASVFPTATGVNPAITVSLSSFSCCLIC